MTAVCSRSCTDSSSSVSAQSSLRGEKKNCEATFSGNSSSITISSPSGKEGVTNEKGEFEYIDGDTVSFNMGSIELGSATPDNTNKVKVTQLEQALLVAQLLQVLDTDADENKIDISDIVIPEAVKKAIIDKLADKDGDASTSDVITSDQLVSVKEANPEKLTLQQRAGVIPKDKILEHIEQQIGQIIFKTIAKNFAYFRLCIFWNFLINACLNF